MAHLHLQSSSAAAAQQAPDRRREAERQARDDRRRASQAGGQGVVPPSPAMVRNGSKQQRDIPNVLTPGAGTGPAQGTPMSAAAQVGVPIGTPNRRMSQQASASHPYANAGYDSYGREDYSASQQAQYGRTSPMVSTVGAGAAPVPPAVSNVGAMRGDVNVSGGADYHGQQEERPKLTLWKIITCSCG